MPLDVLLTLLGYVPDDIIHAIRLSRAENAKVG
jgi:uncharacterized membrane protein YqaE (UPF0057 family)